MITKEELLGITTKKGFGNPQIVEKDYALTWILKAVYENEKLAKYLVFKGGTCLSKVYAQSYRISEDLDFSAYKEGVLSPAELEEEMGKAFEAANRNGAPSLRLKKEETHQNPGMIMLKVMYTGPLGHPNHVKIEISLKEHVVMVSENAPLKEKDYPDIDQFNIHCYHFFELFVEKVRAIMQRGKSRDYYDVWQMLKRKELREKLYLPKLQKLLYEKCRYNDIPYEPEKIFSKERLEGAEKYWQQGLEYLVRELPEFSKVIADLKEEFFEESELARFAEQPKEPLLFDADHLLNIGRQEKRTRSILMMRGIEILDENCDSDERKEVLWALNGLIKMMEHGYDGHVKETFGIKIKINALAGGDRDKEIKQKAEELLKLLGQGN